jgi:aldehyde dehydrogenase (NAD+)
LRARDDDEAVRIANGTRFGLSAAVYGTDLDRASRVARELEAGLVRVNAPTTGVDFHAPFGGLGESSYGVREQGRAARELFTKTQTVTIVPPAAR